MPTKIGLISDIHATAAPLQEALTLFAQENVDLILCAGDIAGYGTELALCIELLAESGCTSILGNHEVWYMDQQGEGGEKQVQEFFHTMPVTWESTIEGKCVFLVHASPPDSMDRGIVLLDQQEQIMLVKKEQWVHELEGYDLDVLIVGHTHQVFAEMLGRILVINPGSTTFNHTCAILSLPDMEVRFCALSGKTPTKVWHWGMMAGVD